MHELISEINFPLRIGLLVFGVFIITSAISYLWVRRKGPYTDAFWFVVGIVFHWSATFNASIIAVALRSGLIEKDLSDTLSTLNIINVIPAGAFYFRSLTLNKSAKLWRIVIGLVISIMLIAYTVEILI